MPAPRHHVGGRQRRFRTPYERARAIDRPLTKEEARCCLARTDELGRPPIGFCGPECERRADRDDRLAARS